MCINCIDNNKSNKIIVKTINFIIYYKYYINRKHGEKEKQKLEPNIIFSFSRFYDLIIIYRLCPQHNYKWMYYSEADILAC